MENKKLLKVSLLGGLFELIAFILVGLIGISRELNGFKISIGEYVRVFNPSVMPAPIGYISLVVIILAILFLVGVIVGSIKVKKGLYLLTGLFAAIGLAFLPFVVLCMINGAKYGSLTVLAIIVLVFAMLVAVSGIIVLALPLKDLFCLMFKKERKEEMKPELDEKVENKVVEEAPVEAKLEEVAAAKVEEAEEIYDEVDPDEYEGENPVAVRLNRIPFEKKLRRADEDLRKKYYGLRDHLKEYGLKNRISIPGDTFSYKRKKYAFVQIVGKHLKLYAAIQPSEFAEKKYRVEETKNRRKDVLPVTFRIKSDLSYRRALEIVDMTMAKAGIAKK